MLPLTSSSITTSSAFRHPSVSRIPCSWPTLTVSLSCSEYLIASGARLQHCVDFLTRRTHVFPLVTGSGTFWKPSAKLKIMFSRNVRELFGPTT